MTRLHLVILLAAVAVRSAVFVCVELKARAKRAWHRIACAWMQCDEAQG